MARRLSIDRAPNASNTHRQRVSGLHPHEPLQSSVLFPLRHSPSQISQDSAAAADKPPRPGQSMSPQWEATWRTSTRDILQSTGATKPERRTDLKGVTYVGPTAALQRMSQPTDAGDRAAARRNVAEPSSPPRAL